MDENTKDVMFSQGTGEHETPDDFFDQLNDEFHFDLDVAATYLNTKCSTFYGKQKSGKFSDGLKNTWGHPSAGIVAWCNPPYGRGIIDWVEKAVSERDTNEVSTVMLLPARTDTKWFVRCSHEASEIRFVTGRLKFGPEKNSAPFPSIVVVFWHTPSGASRQGKYSWVTL
jgi:site-specific DNA-methyltransferase (adenine-specific)